MAESDDRLDSWKEIAAYLKRSVRTVRRWEHGEGLPVHRHVHHAQGTVFAHKSELDAWRAASSRRPQPVASPGHAIAVLPFANSSADAENEYFADGLTDEITANLSKVRALRVISRTSSRMFRSSNSNARTIAAELGVRYLLEGSVRRADNRLRITAQLIDATADAHVWAETYDGTMDDVFAIQAKLARMIVDALELRLTADEEQRIAERAIDNVAAYECYLRARQEGWRWRKDSIDHAVQLLKNGLAIIGDNPRLQSALGLAYLQYREGGIDFGERPLVEAEKCAARVFALERASAPGLQLRGSIHYSRGRIQDAVRDLKAALEIDPNNADTLLLLSNCYLIAGQVAVARPHIARLVAVDPLTPLTRCMPAWADILEGNFALAVEPYKQMFAMDPSNPMARLFYIWVLILNGATSEADAIAAGFTAEVRDTVPARIALFLTNGAPPALDDLDTSSDVFPRLLAQGYARAGDAASAIRWLDAAVDRGFINYPFLARHDPFFAPLRDDARFRALLDRVRKRWEVFEA